MEEGEDAVTSSLSADYGHQAKFLIIFWNHDQELSTGSHGFTVITGFTGLNAKMFSLTISPSHRLINSPYDSVLTSHHTLSVTLSPSLHLTLPPYLHLTLLPLSQRHTLTPSSSHPLTLS
jgi:hypothetical protein